MGVYSDGSLIKVKNKARRVMKDSSECSVLSVSSLMTNYLGIGLDAKIAMGVE